MPFKNIPPFEEISEAIYGKTIVLDIDGTIVPDGESEYASAVEEKINRLRKNNRIFLCSNSRDFDRTRLLAARLGVYPLETKFRKPDTRVLASTGSRASDCVVIGDKFLTDYWLAHGSGAEFIPVARKYSGREILKVRIIYFFDDIANYLFNAKI